MGPVATEIDRRIRAALSPTLLEIVDDSESHRGHAGHDGSGESHFKLRIESPAFASQSRVSRQRMVYDALGDLMRTRIHAMSIDAREG